MELLFHSRGNLSEFCGTLRPVQWRPTIHPEPLILPDTPEDGGGVSAYGTVLRGADGRFRMWYQATPADWDFRSDVSSVAYAESADGLVWHKPRHPATGSHLCDLGLHCPAIFLDPATGLYRATGCGKPGRGTRGVRYGYYTASSADGIQWQFDSPEPQWEGGDVITNAWHPGRGEALVALKEERWSGGIRRRCIRTAAYRGGCYTPSVYALAPDEYDDLAARQRGFISGDYYGMGLLPAGQGVAGFLWNFRHDPPYSLGGAGWRGSCDVSLVYQEAPGDRWLHAPGRPDFISHRDVPWAREAWVHTSSCPVEVGNEHWLYLSGVNTPHGYTQENGVLAPERIRWAREQGRSGITVARWPKYRLFGFDAPAEASFRIQLHGLTHAATLRLNYEARPGGSIRVGVEGGPTAQECLPLEGDAVAAPVRWKTGTHLPASPDGRCTLRLHLCHATLYAYEVISDV